MIIEANQDFRRGVVHLIYICETILQRCLDMNALEQISARATEAANYSKEQEQLFHYPPPIGSIRRDNEREFLIFDESA